MYTVVDLRPDIEALATRRREVLMSLLAELVPKEKGIRIPVDQVLFKNWGTASNLYLTVEGTIRCRFQDRVLFYAEEGDLLGAEEFFGISMFQAESDFSIIVDE